MDTKIDELLNYKEAAAALRLNVATVRSWTTQRRIPHIRLGRRVMYRARDLQQMIDDGYTPIREDKQ